jgi:hypothetical protein
MRRVREIHAEVAQRKDKPILHAAAVAVSGEGCA